MKRAEAVRAWLDVSRRDVARDESGVVWSQRKNCGKLKRGQIEINSRVTKPRLKY